MMLTMMKSIMAMRKTKARMAMMIYSAVGAAATAFRPALSISPVISLFSKATYSFFVPDSSLSQPFSSFSGLNFRSPSPNLRFPSLRPRSGRLRLRCISSYAGSLLGSLGRLLLIVVLSIPRSRMAVC